MKKIILYVLTIAILGIAASLYLKFAGFDFANPFKEQPVMIDKTENVVEEINRLAELTTAVYHKDYVIFKQRTNYLKIAGIKMLFLGRAISKTDELVMITKGKVRAGFDLSNLQKSDVNIIPDSLFISIKIPKAKILDIITNPSDFETFEENGTWTHDEVTAYKNEAREIIEKDALENGILEFAEKSGIEKLTAFLLALGFKNVKIGFNE